MFVSNISAYNNHEGMLPPAAAHFSRCMLYLCCSYRKQEVSCSLSEYLNTSHWGQNCLEKTLYFTRLAVARGTLTPNSALNSIL